MPESDLRPKSKICLECGQPLGPGRKDRKFCNEFCRTAYHNQKRSDALSEPAPAYQPDGWQQREDEDERQIQKIEKVLFENRVKLLNMIAFGGFGVDLNDFYGYGVNLKYFTSEYRDKDTGLVYRMCYDHGYHVDTATHWVYLIYHPQEIYTI